MGSSDVTLLLQQWSGGSQQAADELLELVYAELRQLARAHMRRERPNHTLQATALVHEAYVRLVGMKQLSWQSRAQFFGLAAREMRRVLVDHARENTAQKRGGRTPNLPLDEALAVPAQERGVDVLDLDEALEGLAALDAQQARVVELRHFGGLSIEETAEVLGVSTATVERKWRMGKAYLFSRLGRCEGAL
jgi:RNA polymerase sigma factor (TIGR02999 family)